MTLRIVRHSSAASFLKRAEAWLLEEEAEHNLILGIAHALLTSSGRDQEANYLASIETDGGVVGCAFRTPPFKLGLTRMPAAALAPLVRDVASVYDSLTSVMGPEAEARAFAEHWCAWQGGQPQAGMHSRIYRLDRVQPPVPVAPGRLRAATAADLDLGASWFAAFAEDTRVAGPAPRVAASRAIAEGRLFLWDNGQPVSMAAWTGRTPRGVRISAVYTPPALRGRGYASACVATISQRLLDTGRRFCVLYADLANPTSNAIYRRLGYRSVCDVVDYNFGPVFPS